MEHLLLSQLDACKMKAPLLRQGACEMYAPSMHNMHAPPLRPRAFLIRASLLKQRRHMACLLTFTMIIKLTLLSWLRLSQAVQLDRHICLMHTPLLKLDAPILCACTLLRVGVYTPDLSCPGSVGIRPAHRQGAHMTCIQSPRTCTQTLRLHPIKACIQALRLHPQKTCVQTLRMHPPGPKAQVMCAPTGTVHLHVIPMHQWLGVLLSQQPVRFPNLYNI